MTPEFWAIIGVGVSGLGLGFLGYRGLRDDIRGLHGDIAGLHRGMGGLRERMAKLEGAMDGFIRGMQQAGGTRSAVTE